MFKYIVLANIFETFFNTVKTAVDEFGELLCQPDSVVLKVGNYHVST